MPTRSYILVVNGRKVRQPVFVIGAPHSGTDLLARALKRSHGFHVTIGQPSVLSVAYAFARTPSIQEGRGFLTPPEAVDALKTFGFNLLSLSGNHAFDLKVPGIQNTIRAVDARKIVHAGTGATVNEAAAPGYLQTPRGTVALVAMAM